MSLRNPGHALGFFFMERPSATQRGYNTGWQRARLSFLKRYPLCAICLKDGRTTATTVVDHIVPHRGDQSLFWDRSNWQSLCKQHHDGYKQRVEKSGADTGCDVSGFPTAAGHHWRHG